MPLRLIPCLRVFAVFALFTGWGAGEIQAQPAYLVKDINTTHPRGLSTKLQSPFAVLGTTLFYAMDDGSTGLELWKLDTTTGVTAIVKDICPGGCPSSPVNMTAWKGLVFFIAGETARGAELWRSDGTAAGTFIVRDISLGRASSVFPGRIAVAGNLLFFTATDSVHGEELWATDGTEAGTYRVADINPGPGRSLPEILAVSGDKVLLKADDGVHGKEPWISDGTEAGTVPLGDLNPGTASSIRDPFQFSDEVIAHGLPNGGFVFGADDGSHGYELWRTNGTAAGTGLVKDINSGIESSNASRPVAFDGKIYFYAYSPDQGGALWSTDGTTAGTVMVKGATYPSVLTLLNGQLYFAGPGRLWKSDGTTAGTALMASSQDPVVAIGSQGGSIMFLVGERQFSFSPTLKNLELFKTNGIQAGTVLLQSFGQQDCTLRTEAVKEVNGAFYFYHCPEDGQELWESDGTTTGTVRIQAPTRTPSFPAFGRSFQPLGAYLRFAADDGASTTLAWRTDGTTAGTQPIPDSAADVWLSWPVIQLVLHPELEGSIIYRKGQGLIREWGDGSTETLSDTSFFVRGRAGNFVFLQHPSPDAAAELWRTDGTALGTVPVKDVAPGPANMVILPQQPLGSLFLFVLDSGEDEQLWRSDGTEAGTFALTTFDPSNPYPILNSAVAGGNFFFEVPGGGPSVIWKTDGTVAGTSMVKTLEGPHNQYGNLEQFTPVGNRLVFGFDDGVHGWELWTSDGTEAGTHLLKDIRPGSGSPFILFRFFQGWIVQNRFYFVADDGVHGHELWVTDGTTAGTRMVKDVAPGPRPSQGPREPQGAAVGDRLFFVADDGVHGLELWVTDGTDAGTRLVRDLSPGSTTGTEIHELKAIGDVLVFSASDGVHGTEPWRSDGTEAGTWRIQDIAPGAASSGPSGFTATSRHVYFVADAGTTGNELWAFPLKALNPAFSDVSPNYWAWGFVEALASAGITTGCAPALYCPLSRVTRAEMAVFLERGLHGGAYVPPPATGTLFTDVPAGYWAAAWIEQLAADGITTGCVPNQYCPDSLVSRAEMAVFLLRAKHGAAYTPPPATGTRFTDVPASYWAAAWIEQLAAEGITTGCAPNQYCPGNSVSRDQMAAFLTRTFALPLP